MKSGCLTKLVNKAQTMSVLRFPLPPDFVSVFMVIRYPGVWNKYCIINYTYLTTLVGGHSIQSKHLSILQLKHLKILKFETCHEFGSALPILMCTDSVTIHLCRHFTGAVNNKGYSRSLLLRQTNPICPVNSLRQAPSLSNSILFVSRS